MIGPLSALEQCMTPGHKSWGGQKKAVVHYRRIMRGDARSTEVVGTPNDRDVTMIEAHLWVRFFFDRASNVGWALVPTRTYS